MAQFGEVDKRTKFEKRPRISLGGELSTAGELGLNAANSRLIGVALDRLIIAANNRVIVSPPLFTCNFSVPSGQVWNDAVELDQGSPVSHLAFNSSGKYFILVRSPAYYLYKTDDVIDCAINKTPKAFLQWKSFSVESDAVMQFDFNPVGSWSYVYILGQQLFSGEVVKPESEDVLYELIETPRLANSAVTSFAFMEISRMLVGFSDGEVKLFDCTLGYRELACFTAELNQCLGSGVARFYRLTDDSYLVQFKMAGEREPNNLKTLKIYESLDCDCRLIKGLKDKKDEFVVADIPNNGAICFFSYCKGAPLLINTFPRIEVLRKSKRIATLSSSPEVIPLGAACFAESIGSGMAFVLGSDFGIYPFSLSNKDALNQIVMGHTDFIRRQKVNNACNAKYYQEQTSREIQRVAEFDQKLQVVVGLEAALTKRENQVEMREDEVDMREEKVCEREEEVDAREEEVTNRETEVEKKEAEIKKREAEVKKMVEELRQFNLRMDALQGP